MSKSNEMLQILKRELDEAEQSLLGDICDVCHFPFICNEDELTERCSECSISGDLEDLLKKAKTIAVGETMAITAEEMLRKEPPCTKNCP